MQVFYDAIETGHHTCFLGPDTRLPMMYISDCIKVDLNLSFSKSGLLLLVFRVVSQRTVVTVESIIILVYVITYWIMR